MVIAEQTQLQRILHPEGILILSTVSPSTEGQWLQVDNEEWVLLELYDHDLNILHAWKFTDGLGENTGKFTTALNKAKLQICLELSQYINTA